MIAPDALASTALAAVLSARDLDAAHAAARAGLDRLATEASCDIVETDEAARLAGVSRSTIRRWCAERGVGRHLGGRWIVSRRRLAEMVEDGR